MKKLLVSFKLFALLLCLSLVTNGQNQKEVDYFTSRHEINIWISDIFGKTDLSYLDYYTDVYNYLQINTTMLKPAYGIGYKFSLDKTAYRFDFCMNYDSDNSDYKDENDYTYTLDNYWLFLSISIGFEFHKNFKRTQIFYGTEFKITNVTEDAHYEQTWAYPNASYKENVNASSQSIGIGPLIGVKYYISPHFSISTETKFFVESYTREFSSGVDETKSSGINTQFGPLAKLSFNIHL